MNELQTDWYKKLLEDLKKLAFKGISVIKWQIGDRILQDFDKFGNPKYGDSKVENIARDLDVSSQDIWFCIAYRRKFSNALENVSWREIIKQLPEPKEKENKVLNFPKGKYQVLLADPPWDVKAGPPWASGGESRDLVYPTLSIQQITDMPVAQLVDDNAHLYLWTINKYITESYDIARAWGFEPSVLLTWVKSPHGIGLGGTFVQTTEHLLFCRKGILEAKKRIDTTWFEYKRGKHSEKPEEFRKMIEEVSPGNKIELFARGIPPKGWTFWGNEVREIN